MSTDARAALAGLRADWAAFLAETDVSDGRGMDRGERVFRAVPTLLDVAETAQDGVEHTWTCDGIDADGGACASCRIAWRRIGVALARLGERRL